MIECECSPHWQPSCSALVYPGGLGAMAQAIQAGVPHLVVPHSHDPPDNAARVKKMGLGPAIDPEKYRAVRVASALNLLLNDSKIKQRCMEFSIEIDSGGSARSEVQSVIEGLGRDTRVELSARVRPAL